MLLLVEEFRHCRSRKRKVIQRVGLPHEGAACREVLSAVFYGRSKKGFQSLICHTLYQFECELRRAGVQGLAHE
jgi:hypothetical protein